MPALDVERIKEGARRFASGFTTGQKAVTALGVIGVIIVAVVFSSFVNKPSYSPLFTGLSTQDAAAMTQKLQQQKVNYQLSGDGTTIMVPSSQVYQLRLDMAQAGLPSDGTAGFSLLDKAGITTSDFTQQVEYQQALQQELANTIESIAGVQGAKVSLVIPPTNTFALPGNQSKATASVMVDLGTGAMLSTSQVQAISHLVASSVPNLAAGDVTVVDNKGDVLAAPGVDTSSLADNSQTAAFDNSLAASIQSMLDTVIGPGKADVRVNANLNFDQVTTKSQQIQTNPNGTPVTVPTSTQTSKETYTGTGTVPGGIIGATTPGTGNQNSNYNKTTTNNSYEAGQVTQTIQQAPGKLQNLSVAVLLDNSVTPAEVASVRQAVSAAAGITPARGDVLAVSTLPFSNSAAKAAAAAAAAAKSAKSKQQLMSMIKTGGLLLIVGAGVFLLLRSARKQRVETIYPSLGEPIDVAALPVGDDHPTELVPAVVTREEIESQARQQVEVTRFIEDQPEEVAKLLRGWINEKKASAL